MDYNEIVSNIDRKLYNVNNSDAPRDFFDDLVEAYKLDPTDPITSRMYAKAWENGHSAGYREVLIHFHDLVRVFKG